MAKGTLSVLAVLLAVAGIVQPQLAPCMEGDVSCACSLGEDCLRCPLETGSTSLDCEFCLDRQFEEVTTDCQAGCYFCSECDLSNPLVINHGSSNTIETCQCNPGSFNTSSSDLFIPLGEFRRNEFLNSEGQMCEQIVSCFDENSDGNYVTKVATSCADGMTMPDDDDDAVTSAPAVVPSTAAPDTEVPKVCGDNGHYYYPEEINGVACGGFSQSLGARHFPALSCPTGTLFDTVACTCNHIASVVCPSD